MAACSAAAAALRSCRTPARPCSAACADRCSTHPASSPLQLPAVPLVLRPAAPGLPPHAAVRGCVGRAGGPEDGPRGAALCGRVCAPKGAGGGAAQWQGTARRGVAGNGCCCCCSFAERASVLGLLLHFSALLQLLGISHPTRPFPPPPPPGRRRGQGGRGGPDQPAGAAQHLLLPLAPPAGRAVPPALLLGPAVCGAAVPQPDCQVHHQPASAADGEEACWGGGPALLQAHG